MAEDSDSSGPGRRPHGCGAMARDGMVLGGEDTAAWPSAPASSVNLMAWAGALQGGPACGDEPALLRPSLEGHGPGACLVCVGLKSRASGCLTVHARVPTGAGA